MKKMIKETIGTGVATMAGAGLIGSMSALPGMPAQAKVGAGIAMSGLNLANVGNVANIGMGLSKMLYTEAPKSKKKWKW